jgi:hypothetical protein
MMAYREQRPYYVKEDTSRDNLSYASICRISATGLGMKTIIVRTDDHERSAGIVRCLQMIFPECEILVQKGDNQDAEGISDFEYDLQHKDAAGSLDQGEDNT